MLRKPGYHTRALAIRTRPKAPAPKTGWRITELAELSQISRRTLRYYLEHGLIVPTEFRGTATRYQRRELLRALAITHLRAETGASLAEIKRKFDALGDAELEAWVRAKPCRRLRQRFWGQRLHSATSARSTSSQRYCTARRATPNADACAECKRARCAILAYERRPKLARTRGDVVQARTGGQ